MGSGSLAALTSQYSGLGLRVGDARVVAHDERWRSLYKDLEHDLAHLLHGLDARIEHIGSTAVSGLWAKPILDVGVAFPPGFDEVETTARLEAFGLLYAGDLGDFGGLMFTATAAPDLVVLHVHVVSITNFQWRRYLSFRDALRTRNELASEYSRVKRDLADTHPSDRQKYLEGKSAWVHDTINLVDPDAQLPGH